MNQEFSCGKETKGCLNNDESEWSEVVSGVPQGSVLGPILFNMYVSDMLLIVNSPIVQFADDVKMFRTIVTVNDFLQLQQDFTNGPENGQHRQVLLVTLG